MLIRVIVLSLFTHSALASVTISEIVNRKTGAKIVVEKVTDLLIEVSLQTKFGAKRLTSLDVQKTIEGGYEIHTKRGAAIKIKPELVVFNGLMKTTSNVGNAMGSTISNYWNWCGTFEDDDGNGWTTFKACWFPIPGFTVVIPGVSAAMSTALASTFILGMVVLPLEAVLGGISDLTKGFAKNIGAIFPNAQTKAEKAWNRAMTGRSAKTSDRTFRRLVTMVDNLN